MLIGWLPGVTGPLVMLCTALQRTTGCEDCLQTNGAFFQSTFSHRTLEQSLNGLQRARSSEPPRSAGTTRRRPEFRSINRLFSQMGRY